MPNLQRLCAEAGLAGFCMDRSRAVSDRNRQRVRIAWRDESLSLECVGDVGRMRLHVRQGGDLVAEEKVSSAEEAFRRGREICLALRGEGPAYREGSA